MRGGSVLVWVGHLLAMFDNEFEVAIDDFIVQPVVCTSTLKERYDSSEICGFVIAVSTSQGCLDFLLPFLLKWPDLIVLNFFQQG